MGQEALEVSHQARITEQPASRKSSYRDGSHWSEVGAEAVTHPGRLTDCALCMTALEGLEAPPTT